MTDTRRDVTLRHYLPNLVTILGLGAGLTSLRFADSGDFQLAAALLLHAGQAFVAACERGQQAKQDQQQAQ